jgi:hypothetical protein
LSCLVILQVLRERYLSAIVLVMLFGLFK